MAAVPVTIGMPPLEPGPVGHALGTKLAEENRTAGDRPTSGGTRLRGSQALQCARKIGFDLIGRPADVELEGETLLAFKYGHIAHEDLIQPVLEKEFGAKIEVPASWMPQLSLSCWLDATYTPNRAMRRAAEFKQVAVEIKSMATYGFELAAGIRRRSGDLPGPKAEHVVQSALGALAPDVGADGQHIIYISKERGTVAEWLFGVDEGLPHLAGATPREMVTAELDRMAGILGRIDNGELPRPVIPGHGLVTNPPARDSKGQPWNCRYCAYQPTCAALPADVIPLSMLTKCTEQ